MDLEKMMKQLRKERCVVCPYCEYEHESSYDPEMLEGLITYHGEEEPQEFCCHSCGNFFFVKEHVERKFIEKKTMEEFNL